MTEKLDLVEHATAVPTTVRFVVLLPGVQSELTTWSACCELFAALKAVQESSMTAVDSIPLQTIVPLSLTSHGVFWS